MKRIVTFMLALALACLCGGPPAIAEEHHPDAEAKERTALEQAKAVRDQKISAQKAALAGITAEETAAALEAKANVMMVEANEQLKAGRISKAEYAARQREAFELRTRAMNIRARQKMLMLGEGLEAAVGPLVWPKGDPEAYRETARILAELQGMAGRGTPQPSRVVLVPSGEMGPERAELLTEDLAIMSRVLDKALVQALGQEHVPQAQPGGFAPLFDGQTKQTLYLDGYGTVFLLSVRFPLVGPPEVAEPEPEPEPESLWEQTRRELHGVAPSHGQRPVTMAPAPGRWPVTRRVGRRDEPAFDPERVERLMDVLLDSLPEASHIRGLEPQEAVAVVVIGSGSRVVGELLEDMYIMAPAGPGSYRSVTRGAVPQAAAGVLTVHVRKADVDACAAGDVSPEELRKRATIVIR